MLKIHRTPSYCKGVKATVSRGNFPPRNLPKIVKLENSLGDPSPSHTAAGLTNLALNGRPVSSSHFGNLTADASGFHILAVRRFE